MPPTPAVLCGVPRALWEEVWALPLLSPVSPASALLSPGRHPISGVLSFLGDQADGCPRQQRPIKTRAVVAILRTWVLPRAHPCSRLYEKVPRGPHSTAAAARAQAVCTVAGADAQPAVAGPGVKPGRLQAKCAQLFVRLGSPLARRSLPCDVCPLGAGIPGTKTLSKAQDLCPNCQGCV